MKLIKVHVTDFKSVRDSNPFQVGDVTCLVGKNEAGKTAILEALYRLNPIIAEHDKFSVTDDYPRSDVEEYQIAIEEETREHAIPITADFTLEPAEMAPVEKEFGQGIFKSTTVTLYRAYDADSPNLILNLNEDVAVRTLVDVSGMPQDIASQAKKEPTLKRLSEFLDRAAKEQEAKHTDAKTKATAIADPAEKAKALDEASKLAESQAAKQLRTQLTPLSKPTFSVYVWRKYLAASFPKFLYFDEYYQMQGQVNVQRLKQRIASNALLDSESK
jgi:predicted ATP-dependent endonuclease of OLD family